MLSASLMAQELLSAISSTATLRFDANSLPMLSLSSLAFEMSTTFFLRATGRDDVLLSSLETALLFLSCSCSRTRKEEVLQVELEQLERLAPQRRRSQWA